MGIILLMFQSDFARIFIKLLEFCIYFAQTSYNNIIFKNQVILSLKDPSSLMTHNKQCRATISTVDKNFVSLYLACII